MITFRYKARKNELEFMNAKRTDKEIPEEKEGEKDSKKEDDNGEEEKEEGTGEEEEDATPREKLVFEDEEEFIQEFDYREYIVSK